MLLKYVKENQQMRMVFGCDYCRREISDLSKAIFTWRVDRKTGNIPDGSILIYHKDTCDHITVDNDNEENKDRWQWAPLTQFPAALLAGLGITREQVQEEQSERQMQG